MNVQITLTQARALAIQAQRLHAPYDASADGIFNAFQQLGCVQIDPISHVAKTQHLVLRNRTRHTSVDALNADLDTLLWQERTLFEYWAHCASMVLTEDYGIHAHRMRAYAKPKPGGSVWPHRMAAWVRQNAHLRDQILRALRKHDSLPTSFFEDTTKQSWQSSGWNSGRNITRMFDHLWFTGEVTVAGRGGNSRIWALSSKHLPDSTARKRLPESAVVQQAILKSLRGLGLGTRTQISAHFTRGNYPELEKHLAVLVKRGQVTPLRVADFKETFYALPDALAQSELDIDAVEAMPALLLSPFDNLICDRKRARQLWGFDFTIEIYVPAAKRRFGYYVLPLLHQGRLIGRVDSGYDKGTQTYRVQRVFFEVGVRRTASSDRAISQALDKLGGFLGARRVEHLWKTAQTL
jgi:uncharacterized protein